jgi:hypothetical protein
MTMSLDVHHPCPCKHGVIVTVVRCLTARMVVVGKTAKAAWGRFATKNVPSK